MRLQSVEGIAVTNAMPFIYYERGRGRFTFGNWLIITKNIIKLYVIIIIRHT